METLLLASAALANLTFLNIGAVRLLLHNGAAKVLVQAARNTDNCSLFLKDQVSTAPSSPRVGETRDGTGREDPRQSLEWDATGQAGRPAGTGDTLGRGGAAERRVLDCLITRAGRGDVRNMPMALSLTADGSWLACLPRDSVEPGGGRRGNPVQPTSTSAVRLSRGFRFHTCMINSGAHLAQRFRQVAACLNYPARFCRSPGTQLRHARLGGDVTVYM